MTMPEPKKVNETEDESNFEAEEEPIIIPKAYTKPLQEPPEETDEDDAEEGEYDEVIPDFDGPGGMTASVSVTTWTDGEKTVNLVIDNVTIAIPLEDFLVLVAELKGALPDLRALAK
jgi:hypothetical protein